MGRGNESREGKWQGGQGRGGRERGRGLMETEEGEKGEWKSGKAKGERGEGKRDWYERQERERRRRSTEICHLKTSAMAIFVRLFLFFLLFEINFCHLW